MRLAGLQGEGVRGCVNRIANNQRSGGVVRLASPQLAPIPRRQRHHAFARVMIIGVRKVPAEKQHSVVRQAHHLVATAVRKLDISPPRERPSFQAHCRYGPDIRLHRKRLGVLATATILGDIGITNALILKLLLSQLTRVGKKDLPIADCDRVFTNVDTLMGPEKLTAREVAGENRVAERRLFGGEPLGHVLL